MIVNKDGLSYEDRVQSLKLWSLEERRNRQDLIEVFKMSGLNVWQLRIRLQELFTLEENNKATRGHSLKLAKLRCSRDCWKQFCSNRVRTQQVEWVGSADKRIVFGRPFVKRFALCYGTVVCPVLCCAVLSVCL